MKNKVFLCVITQNAPDHIDEMTKDVWEHLDGLCVVDHSDNNDTEQIVKPRIKEGLYVRRAFYNHTGHSMNDWLLNPQLLPGSWCIIRDTMERVNPDFIKDIHRFVANLERNNINSVLSYQKLLLFKKHEHQIFMMSPHWVLSNMQKEFIEMSNIKEYADPKTYAYNVRPNHRPYDHEINHFLKYYLWDSSNHLLMEYHNNQQAFVEREMIKYKIKHYLIHELGVYPLNVTNLINYWKNNPLDDNMIGIINSERILRNAYRLNIMNETFETLKAKEQVPISL